MSMKPLLARRRFEATDMQRTVIPFAGQTIHDPLLDAKPPRQLVALDLGIAKFGVDPAATRCVTHGVGWKPLAAASRPAVPAPPLA